MFYDGSMTYKEVALFAGKINKGAKSIDTYISGIGISTRVYFSLLKARIDLWEQEWRWIADHRRVPPLEGPRPRSRKPYRGHSRPLTLLLMYQISESKSKTRRKRLETCSRSRLARRRPTMHATRQRTQCRPKTSTRSRPS
jgi:hypothetical protein